MTLERRGSGEERGGVEGGEQESGCIVGENSGFLIKGGILKKDCDSCI